MPSSRALLACVALLAATQANAGGDAIDRWESLLDQAQPLAFEQKLSTINRFINGEIRYTSDAEAWGRKDYWATPRESLAAGRGDCEDYAIAKYFSLVRLGIPSDRLRLLYVKAVSQAAGHMVLGYYRVPGGAPLILDNITDAIDSIANRKDLQPVFSLGLDGVSMARGRAPEQLVTERLPSSWHGIVARGSEDGSLGAPDAAFAGKAPRTPY